MAIKIGTRKSPLAVIQAQTVKNALLKYCNNIEIIKSTSLGDKITGSLQKVGGKGLFIKELEKELLSEKIDIAIHSLKDVPAKCHKELAILPVLKREDPRDAFISFKYNKLSDVPIKGKIGTCAPRREMQLRKDLEIIPIRGNIETRIEKAKNLDGIILSYCALKRLNKTKFATEILSAEKMLPAVGQGCLAAQFKKSNKRIEKLLNKIVDEETNICIKIERDFLEKINGDCTTPLAGFAQIINGNKVYFRAMLFDNKNTAFIEKTSNIERCFELGKTTADEIINKLSST